MAKQNWFDTLNDALESEGLVDLWPGRPIAYGETAMITADDGSRYGRLISIYRNNQTGRYERPVHYRR